MGMLTGIPAFGITRCRLRYALTWFTVRKLFVLSCAVLLLNILFYASNNGLIPWSVEFRFMPALDSELRAILDMTFKEFTEAMESSNVTYFVIAGTLLGSWRHHGFIPWDDDIDVIFNASDLQTVSRVLQSKVAEDPASFGLYEMEMTSEGLVLPWKFYPQNGKTLFLSDFKTPNIDVFFYRENETHIWNTSPYFFTTEIWLKSHVFPVRKRPFGNLMVPAPCNPEAFLEVTLNISVCETRLFNHLLDTGMPFEPMKVPCSRLAHLYPFVHRTNTSNEGSEKFVLETLRLRNSALRRFKARTSC